jgi:hypothetical protein
MQLRNAITWPQLRAVGECDPPVRASDLHTEDAGWLCGIFDNLEMLPQ